MRRGFFLLVLCVAHLAWAQLIPEREMETLRALYDAGKHAEAAERANQALTGPDFTSAQRIELHRLAALSAFHLGDVKAAQASFLQLLRLNPDAVLDPFAVPPAAIKLFEQVRRENTELLAAVKQQLALQHEQEKIAAAEQERSVREERERQGLKHPNADELLVRTVEKRIFLLNFAPFGVGQFQQQRTGWGLAFALSEGLMAAVSIISFFAIEALYQNVTYTLPDRLTRTGDPFTFTARTLPEARRLDYQVWSTIKWITGLSFYGLWALGVGDSLWHHQGSTVSETREKLPTPQARLHLYPVPHGLGAGLSLVF